MPKSAEELEKMFTDLSDKMLKNQKDFDLKLESAHKDAKQFQELAQKREEDLRKYQQDAEKSTREREEAESRAREAEIKEFIEQQTKAGRIAPHLKEAVTTFMKSLASDTEVIKFSEKDGSERSLTKLILFKNLIQAMRKAVPVGEELSFTEASAGAAQEEGESEEHFMEVIEEGVKKKLPVKDYDLAAKAFEYQESARKQGKSVNYYDALIAVAPKNPRK